jgi:hypothetical protein
MRMGWKKITTKCTHLMQELITYFVTTLHTSTIELKTQSESKCHPKHFRLNEHTVPLHVSENDTYQSSKFNICPAKLLCHLKKDYSSCKKLLTQEGLPDTHSNWHN